MYALLGLTRLVHRPVHATFDIGAEFTEESVQSVIVNGAPSKTPHCLRSSLAVHAPACFCDYDRL
jgi:hypothetical protein